ncbi:MAG: hypothetical protein K8963_09275 [Proteobacteria bacterium]|nr:hypothetical protein [Pseudomonadota bacterium]
MIEISAYTALGCVAGLFGSGIVFGLGVASLRATKPAASSMADWSKVVELVDNTSELLDSVADLNETKQVGAFEAAADSVGDVRSILNRRCVEIPD